MGQGSHQSWFSLVAIPRGTEPLTAEQQEALDDYTIEMSRWQSDEAIIKQAIASTIADSLFLEVTSANSGFA